MNTKWMVCFALLLSPAVLSAQDKTAWEELQQNAKKHLVHLVQIDTSAANPDEITAARYIYKQLNNQHIDWDILIPRKGRANLIARLKGTDPSQKPLLLISHLDTANAGEGWTVPPFKATEKEGLIYGLGTTDAKNYTAIHLALFMWLAQQNKKPIRDIILLATSGEETGSETGLLWLGNTHWDKINPGFALNEGGGILPDAGGPDLVFAEAASKQYMDVKLTAYGTEGHPSIPEQNNAVYNLSQALTKLETFNPPARITAPTRTLLNAILPFQNEDGKTTLKLLLTDPNPINRQNAAELMAQDPFFKTQLKDTLTPTQISSPTEKGNTLTANRASAVLNARLLPGTDPDVFLNQLQTLFEGDENIVLEVLERPQFPAPTPMTGEDALFVSIEKTAQKLLPGSITVPGLSPASGDSEFLRKLGVITYGLGPDMDPLTNNTTHTADEHISEQAFYNQLEFLAGVVFDFAYGEDLLPLVNQQQPAADSKEP